MLGADVPFQSMGKPDRLGLFGTAWYLWIPLGHQKQHISRPKLGKENAALVRPVDLGRADVVLDGTISYL